MNKKIVKGIALIVLIMLIIGIVETSVFAVANPGALGAGTDTTAFDNIGGKIIGGLRAIGMIISVVVLIVLGIKYMMGSTEEKAEYKKTLLPYFIGAILIFAASALADMIFQFAKNII